MRCSFMVHLLCARPCLAAVVVSIRAEEDKGLLPSSGLSAQIGPCGCYHSKEARPVELAEYRAVPWVRGNEGLSSPFAGNSVHREGNLPLAVTS